MNLISSESEITVDEIVNRVGKSRSTVKRYIAELKEIRLLERERSDKSKKWIIH